MNKRTAIAAGIAAAVVLGAGGTTALLATTAESRPAAVGEASSASAQETQRNSPTSAGTTPATPTPRTPSTGTATASAAQSPSGAAGATSPAARPRPDSPVPPAGASKPVTTASPAPAPAAPPAAAPAGPDPATVTLVKQSCLRQLQDDAAKSKVVTGTVVPRPFSIDAVAFASDIHAVTLPPSTAVDDVLVTVTSTPAGGTAQTSQRICRVYASDSHVEWLPAN